MLRRNRIRTLARDVVGEQDVQVVEIPSEEGSSDHSANGDPIRAFVGSVNIVFSLGIVELQGAPVYHHVRIGALPKINARLLDGGPTGGDRRDVLEIENRQAFGRFTSYGGHDHAVAVGEKQMQINPGLGVGWKPLRLEFASRQHHLLV